MNKPSFPGEYFSGELKASSVFLKRYLAIKTVREFVHQCGQ